MGLKIGVLASGSGSNLQSILDACAEGRLDAEVAVVVSDVADAYALERAKKAGAAVRVVELDRSTSREAHDLKVVGVLKEYGVDTVALAGYMLMVTPALLEAFPRRVINIHPALLPAFPGTDGYKDTFRYGCKVGGCTVHFIDYGEDTGPIIGQKAFEIEDHDTLEIIKKKGLEKEWQLYPQCIQKFAELFFRK